MNLNIEIPDRLATGVWGKALRKGVTASTFAFKVLEQVLSQQPEQKAGPRKSSYGLLAHHGPGPSAEEIDENRKEMFSGFAEDPQ